MTRNALPLALLIATTCLFLLAPSDARATAAADTLADSTVVTRWTLTNGLRVTTRHIPDAFAVAITVGYAVGTDDDPPGREGLAQLLCEAGFTAPTGDAPERSRDELESQRPLGWSFLASRRTTLLTEIASVDQFPGVLSQVAARMRGVRLAPEGFRAAVQNVRSQMAEQLFGPPMISLYHQVREVGLGRPDDAILRRASGRGLDRLQPGEVEQRLRDLYVPGNAALGLAGNLANLDVPGLVANLFGGIPAGNPRPRSAPSPLRAGTRVMRLLQATEPSGVVAVIGPAVTDSLHPAFFLNTMLLGSQFNQVWRKQGQPPSPRYQYRIFDEPDLVRIFPPVHKNEGPEALSARVGEVVNTMRTAIVTEEAYDELRKGITWLMGGPMSEDQMRRARRESAALHTLARSLATQALWGGEAFWSDYRARLESLSFAGLHHWAGYYESPDHQVRLLFSPAK